MNNVELLSTEKEIKNVRTSRRLFIIKFGIPAICAVHDYKLIVLDIEHFGKTCAGHCYFFRPCVFASAFGTSLFTHISHSLHVMFHCTFTILGRSRKKQNLFVLNGF